MSIMVQKHLLLRKFNSSVFSLFNISLVLTVTWLAVGYFIATLEARASSFTQTLFLTQIPFALIAAFFLGLLARSAILEERLRALRNAADRSAVPGVLKVQLPGARRFTISFVFIAGTVSTTHLGFPAPWPSGVLIFYWLTCAVICLMAGRITWHAIEIILLTRLLPQLDLQLYAYAPARTRELRKLAEYVTLFSIAMTAGYLFSLIGTIVGDWTAQADYVRAVQIFWPCVYVPVCIALLTYPHVMIHHVIKNAKDRLVTFYQADVNRVLQPGLSLSEGQIAKVNSLATLANKIEDTPNYAVNFRIAAGSIATYAVNVLSLALPREKIVELLKSQIGII